MKNIKLIGIVLTLSLFIIPYMVLFAYEGKISPVDELTEDDIKQLNEIEKSVSQEPTLLPDKPPKAEEIEKLIQEQKNNPEPVIEYVSNLNKEGLKNAELGNCFDVYKFNNIQLSVVLDQNTYNPGDIIYIKGELQNKNSYPLPDLKIRGKIVKIEIEGNKRIVKTVDEIILKDNININSLGKQSIEYKYNIPFQAAKGEYEILLSVVQNDAISIAGLSFTDDVYAFNPSFKIGGNNEEEVFINQKEIMINDDVYDNLSFNPRYAETKPVTIKVPIENKSNQDKEVSIEYKVYIWSDDLGKPISKLNQQKTIIKKGKSISSYTIEDMQEAVYYVKVRVKDTITNTNTRWSNISNIRFSNEIVNEPRIAAVLVNTSPYSPEGEMKLVSCIHNTNESSIDTILENTIKDEKGRVIVSSEYKGQVTGQVDGIYTKLPKDKRYNNLIVTSIIKDKEGNILNSIELKYNCKELDSTKCITDKNNIWPIIGIGSIILLSVLSIIVYGVYNIKKTKI